ncbi:MAG TPA: long-chain-acyl-CoA synthetase [Nevskiaceae bacterium]|nr:long-chain-acyl-CoA synthetase [Nevskiaceae bacterium]
MSGGGSEDRVRFGDLLRGVLATLPEAPRLPRGVLNMALAQPERRQSIGSRLEHWARVAPQRVALRFEGRDWTYAEFNAEANRLAHRLRADGIRAGDAVGVLMENRAETLLRVAGIVKLGAVAAMLNHQQRGEVLAHSLKITSVRRLIVGAECREAFESVDLGGLPVDWDGPGPRPPHSRDLPAALAGQPVDNPAETAAVQLKQSAFYIFTSGTTGLPKASRMTHLRWIRGMAGLGQLALRLREDDVFYCCLPLYHNNALTVSWGAVLGAGCTLALSRKFSASRFWDEIRSSGATAFCYIGELLRYLLNRPEHPRDREHAVRLIVGNGLRPELWERFETRFGITRIHEFYGASESNAAFVNGFGLKRTAGYCPLSFAVVAYDPDEERPLRDGRGFLRKVAAGETGLLIIEVSDHTPFDGYTDAQASEKKLLRDVFKKGDCWFDSGDLVRNQGWRHIAFVDRVGDTFRWKGENVATTEVEGALNRFPGVEQAVVYGVEVPGCDGRAGMAALSLSGALDGAALAAHLRRELPAYAVPLFLRLRAEQTLTGTFKFRKVDLKREGFDRRRIEDPLWVLLDPALGYEPLTTAAWQAILAGEQRF